MENPESDKQETFQINIPLNKESVIKYQKNKSTLTLELISDSK